MFFRVKRPRIESNASEDIDASNHNILNKTTDITENIGEMPLSSSHQPPNDIGLYISSTEISNDICSLLLRSPNTERIILCAMCIIWPCYKIS